MNAPPKPIAQAKRSEDSRKAILTKIHRVIDAHENGKSDKACMSEIKQIVGRAP